MGRVFSILSLQVASIAVASSNLCPSRHLLAMIHAVALVSCCAEVSRLSEGLALIELMEVGRVLIDGLRAFLARYVQAQVVARDRVATRVELLNAL